MRQPGVRGMHLSLLFWGLLSVSPALAEVPGARLPEVPQAPALPEQLHCLLVSCHLGCCAALDLCSQHGRPCTNLRRFLFLAWHRAARYFTLTSCRANNLEGHKPYFTAKLMLSSQVGGSCCCISSHLSMPYLARG